MIHFRLFGPVELRDERGIDLHSVLAHSKHLALLAYLAVEHRGMQRRDRLTALLWPDLDDVRSRNALSKALHHLRRAVGQNALITRGNEEVGLNPVEWDCDVIAFEKATDRNNDADALAIYGRGELLDAFHLSDAAEFEQWLDGARKQMRERALKSARALTESTESAGNLAEARKWSAAAFKLAPYDEVALRGHLSVLNRLGDRAGAVSAYQQYADLLGRELDAQPSKETQEFIESIRSAHGSSSSAQPSQRRMSTATAPSPTEIPATPTQPEDSALRAPPRQSHRAGYRRIAFGVATVALLGIAIQAYYSRSNAGPSGPRHRVLVSELENRTGDVKLASLGSMAADWITEGLQETGLTEIVDPVSTLMASRQLAPDTNRRTSLERADAIARQAGADIVVWGSVYREGDSLIYRVQISDIAKQRQIASIEPVAASLTNSVEGANKLRAKVAGALASALDERISSVSAPSSRPPSFDAYKEYVLGLEAFSLRSGVEALPHFEAASRLDPDFASPLVWAIFAYGNDGRIAQRDSVISLLNARREKLRPLDRYALQYFLAGQRDDRNGQFDAARAAARLSPGSEWSHNAAYIALQKNRPSEALTYLLQIDPEHGWARSWGPYWQSLSTALHLVGRYNEELEAAKRIRRINSTDPSADLIEARALVGLGRADDGERLFEGLLLGPHPYPAYPGAWAYAGAQELVTHGHPQLAARLWAKTISWFRTGLAQALPSSVKDTAEFRDISRLWLAESLYQAGDGNEARRLLRELAAKDSTDIDAWGYLGLLAAHANDRAQAESVLNFLATPFAAEHEGYHTAAYLGAEIAAVVGRSDYAVSLLKSLVDRATLNVLPIWLHRDPEWMVLRSYPGFQEMIREK